MKNYSIDASILPNVWIFWETAKAKFYVNRATNEKQNTIPDADFSWKARHANVLRNAGSYPRYAYAKYHDDIEMLEVAEVTFDTRRTAESREWKYAGEPYFIDKAKRVYDKNGNEKHDSGGDYYKLDKDHHLGTFKWFLSYFARLDATTNVVEEFKKFLGSETYTVGSGRVAEVKWTWNIYEWYKSKQRVKKNDGTKTKTQQLVDMLTAMPLKDISEIESIPVDDYNGGYYYGRGRIYFERVNNEWCVLRMFRLIGANRLAEKERMYLHDNGTNRIVSPTNNGWIPARQNSDWTYYKFINMDEAMEKSNRLKYIIPLFENDCNIKRRIVTTLRFPEIEQLMKLGYTSEAQGCAGNTYPKAYIKEMFGGYYNEKEKNLLRKIGLTKHQFDKHMACRKSEGSWCTNGALTMMRKWFGTELAHIDNDTFDKYYDAFVAIRNGDGRFMSYVERANVDAKKFIKNIVRIGCKHKNVYAVVSDTLSIYFQLNHGTAPEINWYFDSLSDAVRAHDVIIALKNQQDAERRALYDMQEAERRKKEEEKRIKLDKKRKELEYEDDNFIIRLPLNGNEIISEGSLQRICIGGYVSRHSTGETNLFFLRKKSEPNIPFYAIEMKHNNIVQIHGYCNKWLGNNPEAIPTVVRWLRKNGIRCEQKILTCMATGYSSIATHCAMPVVD